MRIATFVLLATLCTASTPHVLATSRPEVRSPVNGQRIGEPGDPQCEPRQPCARIRAEGWTPAGRTPFLVVGPVKASPLKWIHPLIDRANDSGTFSGLVYLGESHNGARQWFKIYVYACESADRFKEGDEFSDPPDDCEVSEPVQVYRER
jgi:hypothetical protein